jgi:hypothetical protein
MLSAMVLRSGLMVLVLMSHGARLMSVCVRGHASFCLDAERANRAQHAGRERAAQREQHGEQHQEPDAE